jgi:outer membrane murein-binding lipoprotein Lpp
MPSHAQELEKALARNEELEAAVARLGNDLRKTRAELKDAREAKAQLEKQVDALEKVLAGE